MKSLALVVFALITVPLIAQQDPLYSQYMLNPLLINPAYAGLNDNFNAMVGYRTQWTGLEGRPKTLNASVHSSLVNNKIGVGFVFIGDQTGNIRNSEMNISIAYKLQFEKSTFSFGMQAGVQSFQTDNSLISIYDGDDYAFTNGDRGSRLNIGAGGILKSEKFLIGFSIPRLLPSTFSDGGQEFQLYNQHFYLIGGYIHYLNEHIRLRPTLLLRGVKGAPLSADIAMNVNINAIHTAGVFTRNFGTYGVLLQTMIEEKLRLGYVFEMPTDKSVGAQFPTHEISLGVTLSVFSFHEKALGNF